MSHLPSQAHDLLRRQHGVISRAQLMISGLSSRQVTTLVERGDLVAGLRGTFRIPSAPIDQLSRCTEVCLARPRVTVSAPTAGRLRDWRMVNRDLRVHVISPPASNPAIAPWVVPYRTAAIHLERDIVHRDDGIRTTTPARTALDLARTLDTTALASVIDQAIAKHGVTEDDLVATAVDWRSPQRPWIDTFLRVLGQRLPGGPADSHPEIRVGNALRARGVRHLVRQHPIILPGPLDARFDLAVLDLLWAVEVDVHPSHIETGGFANDERRDTAAEAIGWTISRISQADYDRRLDARLDELVEVYRDLCARPPGQR